MKIVTQKGDGMAEQAVEALRTQIGQLQKQLSKAKEANKAVEQDTRKLMEEVRQLRTELEQGSSGGFLDGLDRLVATVRGAKALRTQIEQLQKQLSETKEAAVEQDRRNLERNLEKEIKDLRTELEQAQNQLQQEREKGFFRRLLRLPARPPDDTERARERMRGKLAIRLLWTLIAVVTGIFAYLVVSNMTRALTMDTLNTLIPMLATTLLTPLVGLIGAVMGFYYGGQTAVQAASQTAEATKTATEAAQTAATTAVQTAAQTTSGTSGNSTAGGQT